MTEKQYETILKVFADKIQSQEETIAVQRWQIEKLEKALAKAESYLKPTMEFKNAEGEKR